MATRSTIGYETADGGYVGVYCHYDGYPDHMGPILSRMYHADVVILVGRALQVGGLSSVDMNGDHELGNGGPTPPMTEWPACPEEYAYRKLIDGRVEMITNYDRRSPSIWAPIENDDP